ncbi:cathepsin L1-like isoform X2 [Contarinia nasturtii]|uniref:cathepsin L1-like isoform X2 n=1 Tax=Contarinia nasturtii TaxID=265458 RepID=UPI0012D38F7D|nr:cathepsin L1-like isoform X2 [Contarinia nasturtii]
MVSLCDTILVISCAIVSVCGNDSKFGRIIAFDNFEHFQASMNKTYHHDHQIKRAKQAYDKNTELIKKHNEEARMGKHSYELRANDMADFSQDAYLRRFVRLMDTIHPDPESTGHADTEDFHALHGSVRHSSIDNTYIPETLDWREIGFKPKPKNQLTCGGCYAFSVATSIEAQIFRRTGKIVQLSPQQIIDCSVDKGNTGCHGGSLRATLKYLDATRGLMRESDYPYASELQKCQYKPSLAIVNVTKWAILRHKDEESLKKAIAVIGPNKTVNHAMLAVGYTPDYFILQNWWGDRWGENGYMKIERHQNRCGIANYAAYAMV